MAIHPNAIVSEKAVIGKNPTIGPFAVIEDDVVIGDDCFIDSHVKICRFTTIGDRSRFYLGCLIGEEPQDHRMTPGIRSRTIIGSDTILREYVTVHRSPFENGETVIGDHTLLMAFVHVAHDARIGNYVTCANHTALSGHVIVEDGAVMSGYIMLHQFCRIGKLAMVSPGAKLRQDVPPFALLSEKNYICGSNVVGLRRAGFTPEERTRIKKAIKIFFFKGLNAHNALEAIREEGLIDQNVQLFCDFITKSERGIAPADPDMLSIGTKYHADEDESVV